MEIFDKVDAQLDSAKQLQLARSRIKADRIKDDLLFELIAEDIALTQGSHGLRIKPFAVVGLLILYKGAAHGGHAAGRIQNGFGHRIDAIAALGFHPAVNHC